MSTPESKTAPTDWELLRREMESSGPDAVIGHINSFPAAERLPLYSFAQRALNREPWAGKNFDGYIAVAAAGIAEAIRQSGESPDEERRDRFKDAANVISYNLAADLATCWPGDEEPREPGHFEAGLLAAENCIRWRDELGKPGSRRAMAHWAKGIHLLALGELAGSTESFRSALEWSAKEAAEQGRPTDIAVESSFDLILHAGYLGLAETLNGAPEGRARFAAACSAFEKQAEHGGEAKEDATFGLEQLRHVKRKFHPR